MTTDFKKEYSTNMARDIVLNLGKNAPVASARGKSDRVPEGAYTVKPTKLDLTESSNGNPMCTAEITITKGPLKGKKVLDTFVFMPAAKGKPAFGVQRFHGLAVACGLKPVTGKVNFSAVAKRILDKECVCSIEDNEMPANDNYPARTVSRPVEFRSIKSTEGQALLSGVKGGKAPADDDEEDEDEDADDKDDDEDDSDDDDDEEEPVAKKSKKAKDKPAKKGKKKASKDDDDDEDEEEDEDSDDDDDDEDDD